MKSNHRVLSVCAVATLLIGCGGGSGSPIVSTGLPSTANDAMGSARLPSAHALVPDAIHRDVSSVVTILHKGKPTDKGSWVKLYDDKGKEVASGKTGANGDAVLRNVPQRLALRLKFQVKREKCVGQFPNIRCHTFNQEYGWPGVDKMHSPPFPATLECDVIKHKNLCKKT